MRQWQYGLLQKAFRRRPAQSEIDIRSPGFSVAGTDRLIQGNEYDKFRGNTDTKKRSYNESGRLRGTGPYCSRGKAHS